MSVSRGFGLNGKSIYNNICKPMEINIQFTVNHADTNGAGVTSVKSNGYIQNVFMNTNQTPATGNPNPAVGIVMIQLKQNFNAFINCLWEINSPNSGSSLKVDDAALTVGNIYTITTLGNATAAQWTLVGVPSGVTPAVGVSFICANNGGSTNTSTSRVQAPSVSGINCFEIIGTPNVNTPSNIASNAGQYIYGQFLAATSSSVTTLLPTAPADGSVVSLQLYFDGSSVTIKDDSVVGASGL